MSRQLMRKVRCPVCDHTKRPYGLPRTKSPRPSQPHQMEYEIGTFQVKCDKCGTTLFIKMDYVLELAPVDISEVWASDGTVGEVINEKRGSRVKRTELERVDEDTITRPLRESNSDD